MKFRIDVESFLKAVKPATDIASKNVKKYDNKEPFDYAGLLTIEASQEELRVKAYGGTASIIVTVDKADGYIPDVAGALTANASAIADALKSFLPTDKLIVSTPGQHMKFALESDPEIFIEFRAWTELIECPPIPRKSEQESLVDRACFVKGIQAVAYAMAVEEKMFTYMCMLFESWKNRMRFTAGSGGRFASFSIDCDSRQILGNETKILFPKANVSNVIRIFKSSSQPTIRVRTAEQDVRNDICEQIILENGNITLALYGIEKLTKYPDVGRVIAQDYSYRITTHMRDWISVVEAIKATYHSHEPNIHNTEVTADLLHGHFEIRTRSETQIGRKVDFWLGAYVADDSVDKDYKPWFRCNSDYLLEMVQKGCKDGLVTFHFDDQAKLDDIPKGKPKQMKPVLVTFPEKANKEGIREKYSVFFTVSTK